GDVDWAFGAPTLGEIEKRLHHLDTPWAAGALVALESASPQSLEITHALLARGRQHTLRECLGTELALTRTAIRTPHFLEGIRAGGHAVHDNTVTGTVSVVVGHHRDHDLAGLGTALLDVRHRLERLVEREGAVDDRAELPAVVEGAEFAQLGAVGLHEEELVT